MDEGNSSMKPPLPCQPPPVSQSPSSQSQPQPQPQPQEAQQQQVQQQLAAESLETQSMASKRESVGGRSIVWKHFTKFSRDNEKWSRCKHCLFETRADRKKQGTGPMLQHIRKSVCIPCDVDDEQSRLSNATTENDEIQLGVWKFDQTATRKTLFKMIVIDELPLKFVDGKGFRQFMEVAQLRFHIPSRWIISRDIFESYVEHKTLMKASFKNLCDRVCLTIDTWTSIQRNNYMCLTIHFIDRDWKLHKRIINFCPISSHKGEGIARMIEQCLKDWGIERVLTITVDNASSNDVVISHLKRKFNAKNNTISSSKYLHMRCVAHIVNLIVVDGVKELGLSVSRIRSAVRYVINSSTRLAKFRECAENEGITCKLKLALDVSTRWNSTYIMLETAQNYEKAFEKFEEVDYFYKSDLDADDGVPTYIDWINARKLVKFLRRFYELTLSVSGSLYVTSNTYFREISTISIILTEMLKSGDLELMRMAISMKVKYDKYWADMNGHNMLTYVAMILDPRRKFDYVKFALSIVHDEQTALEMSEKVKEVFDDLFEEYKVLREGAVLVDRQRKTSSATSCSSLTSTSASFGMVNDSNAAASASTLLDNMFKKHQLDSGCWDNKTEVEQYLSEGTVACESSDKGFDILLWWKVNSFRFPILGSMARDVLAIPISTVSSESAFNTGGRILDSYRSSLTPKMVQTLVCLQNWLKSSPVADVEGELEEAEQLTEEFQKMLLESIDL